MRILVNPERIRPPHKVYTKRLYKKLYKSMERNGWKGYPLVAVQTIRTTRWDYYALNGSHRIAAARKSNTQIPVIVLPSSFLDDLKVAGYTDMFVEIYDDADVFANDRYDYYKLPWHKYKLAAKVLAAEE